VLDPGTVFLLVTKQSFREFTCSLNPLGFIEESKRLKRCTGAGALHTTGLPAGCIKERHHWVRRGALPIHVETPAVYTVILVHLIVFGIAIRVRERDPHTGWLIRPEPFSPDFTIEQSG
jgi:hypothetical protein